MMSQAQFTELKKSICTRLLDEMPEAALGELIATMREIKDHYAAVSPKQQNAEEAQPTTSYKAKTLPTRPDLETPTQDQPVAKAIDTRDTDPTPPEELKEAMKIQRQRKAAEEKASKPTSIARPEDFAEQLANRRKEKEQAIAEAKRIARAKKNAPNSA